LLRNVCSSNSSGDLNPLNAELNPICHLLAILGRATIVVVSRLRVKVPSQQKVLFPMVSFLSRSTALFWLQILCNFGWKWNDRGEWWRGDVWKERTDLFHSPADIRNFVLQNTSPVRPNRLVLQKR